MKIFDIRQLLLIVATVFIFLNLTIYLPIVKIFPYPAYVLDLILFVLLFIFYIKSKIRFPHDNIIILWVMYYIVLNIIYFIVSPSGPDEYKFFKLIVFFIFFIFSMIMLFNLDDDNLSITRKVMVPLAMIATITLGLDFFETGFFINAFQTDLLAFPGRASGLYLNANIAGGAMIVFLIFTIDLIPKKYRIIYISIIFLGVFFTMSRSNLMILFITIAIMFFQKKLYTRHLLISFTGIIVFFIWLSSGGLDMLGNKYDLEVTDEMVSRVNFFVDSENTNVDDMSERKVVLMAALEMFADNPLFGSGFAATRLWDHKVGPHNTFAAHWAEFGLFGMFIIPLLLFLSTYNIFKYANSEQKQVAILVIIYFITSSFFSHNMLDQPFQVAVIIALATIGYKRKTLLREDLD